MSGRRLVPLAGQPWLVRTETRRLLDVLERDGAPARFVGGVVRDGLLGLADDTPDIDVATAEPPNRVMAFLDAAGMRAVPTGIGHGTVTALVDDLRYEVTTLRRDVATDGRHAVVAYTDSFEEDAARRDFTINAMSADRLGEVFDYFGGQADLAAGRVRFIGDPAQRIAEDRLRILRFFRFVARFGCGPPDAAGLHACASARTGIRQLSGERVQVEMSKLLGVDDPLPALGHMVASGVADEVFAGTVAEGRLAALLEVRPDASPILRLAALLRPPPASPPAAADVAARWRLSSADAARLLAATQDGLPDLQAGPAAWRRQVYALGAERFADLASLGAAEDEVAVGMLARALEEAEGFDPPPLPVGGTDVLALGVPPGPAVGDLLRRIEAEWLASDFALDRAGCLDRLRRYVAEASGRKPPAPPGGDA